jgi:hypothetical protein
LPDDEASSAAAPEQPAAPPQWVAIPHRPQAQA